MSKIKCDLKKISIRGDKKGKKEVVPSREFDAFDYSDGEQNEKLGKGNKGYKVENVKGIRNGEIVIDKSADQSQKKEDPLTLNFINNLENKLNRINSTKKIVYLNFPIGSNEETHSNECSGGGTGNSIEYVSDDNVSSTSEKKKKGRRSSSKKKRNKTDKVREEKNERTTSYIETIKEHEEKNINSENDNTSDDENSNNSLFNDPDILPDFSTSLKGSERHETLCSSNLSLNTDEYNSSSNLPETSLAFKRKQFLEKINNKEEEFVFKNELNLYKDFKEHKIEIEDYGRLILNKMGYDEETYNTYINKYYKETSDSNYFDKIYEQFHTRTFRFTGIGTEGEMEENLEHIKNEGDGKISDKDSSNRKEKGNASLTELKKSSREIMYSARKEDGKKTEEKKRKRESMFDKEPGEWKSNKRVIDRKRGNEKGECYSPVDDEKNEKNYTGNSDFFEGLIVKINLKTHEHYKRKGIIIFKKRKKDEIYYGLLLFRNYELVDCVKKRIIRKLEEAHGEEPSGVKYFWLHFIKELNKKVSLEKEVKRYDIDEKKKKITNYFDIAEVKCKYLETVIRGDCSKCKIVSTLLRHPRKKTSMYKETVELLKIKSNYAYIKYRKKYNMKVSLDDICECIDYSAGNC